MFWQMSSTVVPLLTNAASAPGVHSGAGAFTISLCQTVKSSPPHLCGNYGTGQWGVGGGHSSVAALLAVGGVNRPLTTTIQQCAVLAHHFCFSRVARHGTTTLKMPGICGHGINRGNALHNLNRVHVYFPIQTWLNRRQKWDRQTRHPDNARHVCAKHHCLERNLCDFSRDGPAQKHSIGPETRGRVQWGHTKEAGGAQRIKQAFTFG